MEITFSAGTNNSSNWEKSKQHEFVLQELEKALQKLFDKLKIEELFEKDENTAERQVEKELWDKLSQQYKPEIRRTYNLIQETYHIVDKVQKLEYIEDNKAIEERMNRTIREKWWCRQPYCGASSSFAYIGFYDFDSYDYENEIHYDSLSKNRGDNLTPHEFKQFYIHERGKHRNIVSSPYSGLRKVCERLRYSVFPKEIVLKDVTNLIIQT